MELARAFINSALFPFPTLFEIITTDPQRPPNPTSCGPYDDDLKDYAGVQGSLVKDVLLAVFIYTYTMDISAAATWSFSWMWPIIVRDLVIAFGVGAGWDYLWYFSPLAPKLRKFKLNPAIPPISQFKHDAWFTFQCTLTASALEIVVLHLWAIGVMPYYTNFWEFPVWSVGLILTMPYWRLGHFYCIHRLMHPWRIKGIPDGGALLYKYAHSHHHKSHNPSALSGVSMHPIEAFMYYSATLLPFFLRATHPIVFAATKVDLTIGAQIGHDGFNDPGGVSFFHFLHHKYFECNYGDKLLPTDYLFGSFHGEDKPLTRK